MMICRLSLLLMLTSCSTAKLDQSQTKFSRSEQYQQQIDQLLTRDAENKRWARVYLREIDAAMVNDDMHAYVFFVGEYEQTPLEIVPEWLRSEPGYVQPPSDLELFFRLRWFEQAVILYKKMSIDQIKPNHL